MTAAKLPHDPAPAQRALCAEFDAWCLTQGFPRLPGDDPMLLNLLNARQRRWLISFVARWDIASTPCDERMDVMDCVRLVVQATDNWGWADADTQRRVRELEGAVAASLGMSREAPHAAGRWQPIDTAPHILHPILLWLPPVGGWLAGPWRGSWSFAGETWVLHTPMQMDGKIVCLSDNPEPTHWAPLRDVPSLPPAARAGNFGDDGRPGADDHHDVWRRAGARAEENHG